MLTVQLCVRALLLQARSASSSARCCCVELCTSVQYKNGLLAQVPLQNSCIGCAAVAADMNLRMNFCVRHYAASPGAVSGRIKSVPHGCARELNAPMRSMLKSLKAFYSETCVMVITICNVTERVKITSVSPWPEQVAHGPVTMCTILILHDKQWG